MGSITDENITGYWIGEAFICKYCIYDSEVEGMKMQSYHEKLNSEAKVEEIKRGKVIPLREAQGR
ncbi:MAG TPA: hypothetical protein VLW47_09575 [Thermodesulfobacteriota bacterium]|nr:hypothetical protein [Thermodesulfobacteriota bacterium]